MKNSDRPSNRRETDPPTASPFGASPDGLLIVTAEELPALPIPGRVVVMVDHIEIDGWVFPFSSVTKSWLVWFQKTLLGWADLDKSVQNKLWLNGIAEAFEARISGKL